MRRPYLATLAIGLAALLFGQAQALAQENPIRGTIRSVETHDRKEIIGRILVDRTAFVWISKQTKIYKLEGKNRKAAKFEDLKPGQQVEAPWSGGVDDSDPPQVQADEVLILGDKKPDIRGAITKVSMPKFGGLLGMVLVEEKGGKPFDKIWARVTKETKIFKLDVKDRMAATFDDLKVGVRIEARFDREIASSDPPQGIAIEIVILPAAKK